MTDAELDGLESETNIIVKLIAEVRRLRRDYAGAVKAMMIQSDHVLRAMAAERLAEAVIRVTDLPHCKTWQCEDEPDIVAEHHAAYREMDAARDAYRKTRG